MKILVFNPRSITCSRAGGAEVYAHEIFNRIALSGHKIFVASSSDKGGDCKYVNANYLENVYSKDELFFPLSSIRCAKLCYYFDVVIENVSKFPIVWLLLLSKLLSKPFIAIVYHIHGKTLFKELPPPLAFIFYMYEAFSLKLYSLLRAPIVAVSRSTKRELMKLGFPSERISVVSCGVSLKFKDNSMTKSEEPLLAYVGRVKNYKRLDHLIKALEIVVRKVPNVRCVIAGKGDDKVYSKLKALAKRLGAEANIRFEGEIDEKRKLEILKKAWVYVMPSMKEGFSISSLEAQAYGTPVVGYRIPGLVDSVKDGVTGFLVNEGDYRALAEAILHLLLDEELRTRASRNAFRWTLNFSWDRSAEKFLKVLTKSLNKDSEEDRDEEVSGIPFYNCRAFCNLYIHKYA